MLVNTRAIGTGGNAERALYHGGYNPNQGVVDSIHYVNMSSNGNFADFGDLTNGSRYITSGTATPVRYVASGGLGGDRNTAVEFVTIATTSNSTDFGNLVFNKYAHTSSSGN